MSETKNIPINQIEPNKGQIEGLPKNPRFIKDARFEALKKSIEDAPEMLALRELIVYPIKGQSVIKYVAICGNMRLRACQQLGYKELPCKVLPIETPVEKLREYTIKDNVAFGQDSWDELANEWETNELIDWGVELPETTFLDDEPTDLDGEDKKKPFAIKITFDSEEKLNEFRDKYEKIIQDEFKVIISVSGGEL